jgi:hypothetical protein
MYLIDGEEKKGKSEVPMHLTLIKQGVKRRS